MYTMYNPISVPLSHIVYIECFHGFSEFFSYIEHAEHAELFEYTEIYYPSIHDSAEFTFL